MAKSITQLTPKDAKNENPEELLNIQYPVSMTPEERREYHEEKRQYVMCPTPGCREKLLGSWKDHETGETKQGLKVYKCPGCGNEFTVNDFKINAMPVPNQDGVAVVYDKQSFQVLFKVPGRNRFIDADDIAYVHIPLTTLAQPNAALLYLSDIEPEDFTDAEISDVIMRHEKNKKMGRPDI